MHMTSCKKTIKLSHDMGSTGHFYSTICYFVYMHIKSIGLYHQAKLLFSNRSKSPNRWNKPFPSYGKWETSTLWEGIAR